MSNTMLERWNQYWFSGEGRLSLAVARVAVGLAALTSIIRFHIDYGAFIALRPESLYTPRGILRLLGSQPPSTIFLQGCEVAGVVFLLLFMAGWRARLTGTVALAAHLILISMQYAFLPGWTHGYNMVYLAFLAVVWGPHDRAAFSLKPGRPNDGTRWPVLLAQAVLSVCFLGAALWKIRSDLSFSWIWSDSLRYHMFTRYLYMDEPRTALVSWIMAEPWRYKGVALMNIVAQILPVFAVFFTSSPRARAIAGFFFILEIFGLAFVMELRNWHWLPLAAVFFDWDALLVKRPTIQLVQAPPNYNRMGIKAAGAFIFAFLLLHATVVLTDPTLSGKLNAYPFTNFRLYVQVRATPDLTEHRDYQWIGARFAADGISEQARAAADEEIRKAQRWMQWLHLETRVKRLAGHTEEFARILASKGAAPSALRMRKDILNAESYPAPITLNVVRSGLTAVWESGAIRAVSADRFTDKTGRDCIQLESVGPLESIIGLTTSESLIGEPGKPDGTWAGSLFCFAKPQGDTVYAYYQVRFAGKPEETYLAAPLHRPAQSFLRRIQSAMTDFR